jgi:hypothetical protein
MTRPPLMPEVMCGQSDEPQSALPLAAQGVQRFVWQMRHGAILIEVRGGMAYVNGERVEPIAETLRHGVAKSVDGVVSGDDDTAPIDA